MQLETLRARVTRADYDVDPHAVAEAIVRRLLEVRGADVSLFAAPDGRSGVRAVRPAVSGDVLEAG